MITKKGCVGTLLEEQLGRCTRRRLPCGPMRAICAGVRWEGLLGALGG
jgi:hypothetical protein